MSIEVSTSFVQQFRSNLVMLAQQMPSRLESTIYAEPVTGTTAWYDQIGTATAQRIINRHADTPIANIQHRRRRIDVLSYNVAELIDGADRVRMLADPSSAYAQALVAAMNRQKDDLIIAQFFASANTGADGTTAVTFPAANQVAVNSWKYGSGSGNAGLTISKLIEAKALMDAGEVEETERYIAVSAKQLADLLGTTEVTSSDFNAVQALVSGQISTFLGFNFIRSERLPIDGSSYRRVAAWQKMGMYLGKSQDIIADLGPRRDKNNAMQAYYEMTMGCARVEEARVIEIKCLES